MKVSRSLFRRGLLPVLVAAASVPSSVFAAAGDPPFTVPTGFDPASLSSAMFSQTSSWVLIGGGAIAVMAFGIALYRGLSRKATKVVR